MTFRIIILSFFISLSGLAQFNNNNIDFESYKRQFHQIPANSDTVDFGNKNWSNGQVTLNSLAIGFDFHWGGHSFDSLDIMSSGGFSFDGGVCSDPDYGYNAFISWEIIDRILYLGFDNDTTYTDTALTPVKYYRGTDSLGYNTFTVQWLNVPSRNYEGDSLSFQLKLNERDNSIEIHYGELIIDETTWPDFNILTENTQPYFFLIQDVDCESQSNNSLALVETNNDSATLHSDISFQSFIDDDPYYQSFDSLFMKSPPEDNTVWKFKMTEATSTKSIVNKSNDIKVYPNPSKNGIVSIKTNSRIKNISFINSVTGQQVRHSKIAKNRYKVNGTGLHLIKISTDNGIVFKKLMLFNN